MTTQPRPANPDIRVRFAPSPTGSPHVGTVHTALFNWLFARHEGGTFILRIEDTDIEREIEGAVAEMVAGLRWLGLDWDEGPEVGGPYAPYTQSQRLPLYHGAARRLIDSGLAYYCYCSEERLEALRLAQERAHLPTGYDRHCRNLTPEEVARYEADEITPVVRFRSPVEGRTTFHDMLRGAISVDNRTIDDFILLKSNGYPVYALAAIVDDHEMRISHVIRGEDWLPSTPRHLLVYRAFGYEVPVFVHVPLILATDRSKLSKRHGATSIAEFQELGYLPDALLNYLALMGWSKDGKTELMGREELVESFTLDRLGKTPAIFNYEKLGWMNGVYIRQMDADALADALLPFLDRDLPPTVARPLDRSYVRAIVPLVHERLRLMSEAASLTDFFFLDRLGYHSSLLTERGLDPQTARQALAMALDRLQAAPDWEGHALEALLRPLAEELGLKTGPFFGLLRVATTGRTAAPPLFATMEVLGRERCLGRIEAAREMV